MSVEFFKSHQKLNDTDTALKASLLSGSFEVWRREQYKAPIYVPGEARAVLPLDADQITPHLIRQNATPGYDYVQRAVSAQLTKCDERFRKSFSEGTRKHRRVKVFSDKANKPEQPSVSAVFDPDTLVSTVSVCSVFDNISRADGKSLVERALPSNWSDSPGGFFQSVRLGKFANGSFLEDKTIDVTRDKFQIEETVRWSWAPRIEATGGMVNVLTIAHQTDARSLHDQAFASGFVNECRKRVVSPDSRPGEPAAPSTNGYSTPSDAPSGAIAIDYTYGLVNCVRSKFLSTWTPGGLDLDDGRYMSIWMPTGANASNGTLYTSIEKRVHFSSAADVLPQFSRLANLLSPAVVTMLLRQLAFDSTLVWLQGQHNPEPQLPTKGP